MKYLYSFITALLVAVSSFAQTEKDSLLEAHADSIQQRVLLMHYLDHKALLLQIKTKAEIGKVDKDFKSYYADSVVVNNPTSTDISSYLNFRPGKQPKNAKKFIDAVYEANALEVLRLTEQYGYLSFKRTKFKIDGRGVSLLQFTFRTGKYHRDIAKIFEAENKSGNMSDQDLLFFTTVTKTDGSITEKEIKELEDGGIKLHQKNVNLGH